ncbi:CmpA/NrtA family ABC transporter substrate-binding protein [Mesorhizobium sp. KR9-304]|uniref:CmpA/NrtA family ABC transporter substrate-binding protein n=1 Tax=Mesorhizobium sp. KR9-304 TaxID=3156614 RepID=UPI0032B47CE6
MTARPEHQIDAAFMPLFDSAVLIAAREIGFAEREGVDLVLHRETSWANIRDRIAIGHFDIAHMLGPMPIACNLGLTPLTSDTIVPFALGVGGNCVTVSNPVWEGMADHGAVPDLDPETAGRALGGLVRQRTAAGKEPLRLGVVHPHSGHYYELCYWLAACGIDPLRDIEIVIVPPPFMADALAAGRLDGYCVGEPWNSLSVARGIGHIATVKAKIWRNSPEKVVGVRKAFADERPDALAAMLRALHQSARWCQDPANRDDLALLMAQPRFLGVPPALQMPILTGRLTVGDGVDLSVADFFLPFDKGANFPWKSHALWLYTQMVRWGQVAHTPKNEAAARDTYRPDLYRAALKPLGVALPGANAKVEGALAGPTPVGSAGASLVLGPDGFFDGGVFDPDRVDAYVVAQAARGGDQNPGR